jgi:hypothetical protein
VEVQVRVEVPFIKGFDRFCVSRLNMQVPHVFADHGSVLGFDQAIVVGVPRPRFRLLHQQFGQQFRHPVIDKLAAIVGMEAEYAERKLPQHRFQHRNQPGLADLRRGSYHLPLRHFVHRVDVVHPLGAVRISLMHRVDPQVPRPALRIGPPPLPNIHLHWLGLLVADFPLAIHAALTQVVDVRYRYR